MRRPDWRQDARDALSARTGQPAVTRFAGDPKFCAQLLPFARTLLGDLIGRLALGGIAQGARLVTLSDGSTVRAVTNDGIHVIEIDRQAVGWQSALAVAFLVHPHSDAAPNGWWWTSAEATEREVQDDLYYPRHSFYSDEGVDTDFWWETYNRPHALIAVNQEQQRCKLIRDRDMWYGNQTVYSTSGVVWSWWHSPHGDAPLTVPAGFPGRARHVPYLSGGALRVIVNYDDDPAWELATITPVIFRDSQLVWSYADDDISDQENEIDADDSAIIGGVYPVSGDRILVIVITNQAKTATLYDVRVHPPDLSTKTTVWTVTVTDANALRWPWRFSPDGDECSTIVQYARTASSVPYPAYKIWTLTIGYNSETDAFSASKAESADYFVRYTVTSETDQSGYVYLGIGTWDIAGSNSNVVDETYNQVPLALAYRDTGERVIAWLDSAGTASEGDLTYSYTGESVPGGKEGTASESITGSGTTRRRILINDFEHVLIDHTYASSSSTDETLTVEEQTYSTESELTSERSPNRLVYLDVLSNTVITYADATAAVTGASTSSASWLPDDIIVDLTVGGGSTYPGGDFLWIGDTPLIDDPAEAEIPAVGGTISRPLTFEQTHTSPSSGSSTVYSYGAEINTILSLDVGFGMAIDRRGFFVLSYDCKERQANLGGEYVTLERKTGNHSNAPGFAGALAFDGENRLLFPVGIGSQRT